MLKSEVDATGDWVSQPDAGTLTSGIWRTVRTSALGHACDYNVVVRPAWLFSAEGLDCSDMLETEATISRSEINGKLH